MKPQFFLSNRNMNEKDKLKGVSIQTNTETINSSDQHSSIDTNEQNDLPSLDKLFENTQNEIKELLNKSYQRYKQSELFELKLIEKMDTMHSFNLQYEVELGKKLDGIKKRISTLFREISSVSANSGK
jgi:hypothetical protein